MGPGSLGLCRRLHNGAVLSCGRCSAVIQEVLNSNIQLGDVQRRLRFNTSSCSSGGMIVGAGDACGLREKNSSSQLWVFVLLVNAVLYAMNANVLRRCDRVRSLAEPLFNVMTTAMLSQRHWTYFPTHSGPHSVVATTIGTSSFGAMVTDDHDSGHCS